MNFWPKNINGSAQPGLFSVFPDRAGGPSVRRTWSTMTLRQDGVDATANACTGFYLCAHAQRIWNFNFQQSVKIFTATPNILCACNICFCWWIENIYTGETPKWKPRNNHQVFLKFAHVYFFLLLRLGAGVIEHLRRYFSVIPPQ